MIEIPECFVLADQINETLKGKRIKSATANTFPHSFAWYSGEPSEYNNRLTGKTVVLANAGTEYTCGGNTEILCDDVLLVVSTPIKYHAPGEKLPAKHQLLLEFEDESHMSCTVQMWGAMLCCDTNGDGIPIGYEVNRSPSPLSKEFDRKYFDGLMAGCKPAMSAKAFLATEQRIPGFGNGVLQDVLFNARIHPKKKLSTFTDGDCDRLFDSVKDTLLKMRNEGGRDTEKDLYSMPGGYKTILSNKTVKYPCGVCGDGLVRETYLGGNIYFCPSCQRGES